MNSGLRNPHAPFPETFAPRVGALSSKGLGQGPRSFGVPSFARPSLKPCFLRQPRFLSSCRGDDSSGDSPTCAAFFDSPPRVRLDIGRKQGSLDRGPRHREDGTSNSYGRANSGWVWGQARCWWIGNLPQGLRLGPCNSCQPQPPSLWLGSELNLCFLNLPFHSFLCW